MVTGDYGLTAEAIARRIGIVRGDEHVRVITGVDLEDMTRGRPQGRAARSPRTCSSRRVAPEHKMQVVSALKDMGEIVAVTGDGVNDAPALKKADIGVAMGLTGTDVSREAATMILLDDSFASIIKAVEQGRGVYANVKKMITYIFSHNMAELFPFVFAALGGVGLVPLGALQVLAIDLGSDVLPGLALGTEHPEPGVMKQPPRARSERLLSRATLRARRVHRRHPVRVRRDRLPLRAAVARLDVGRRELDGPLQRPLRHLQGGADDDAGRHRRRPGRQRLRLPHRARVAVQGRPLHQPLPASSASSSASASWLAISYVPFIADIFKTGPLTLRRLGLPGDRRPSSCSSPRKRENGSCGAGRHAVAGRRHRDRKEGSLMKVIIVGCGRVGAHTAAELAREGHDVVVIDKDPLAFRLLPARLQRAARWSGTPSSAPSSRRPASPRPTPWWRPPRATTPTP